MTSLKLFGITTTTQLVNVRATTHQSSQSSSSSFVKDLLPVSFSSKMIFLTLCLFVSLVPVSGTWTEFGRHTPQDDTLFHQQRIRLEDLDVESNIVDIDRRNPRKFHHLYHHPDVSEVRIIEEFEEMLNFLEMSLSLSMSMSMPLTPGGSGDGGGGGSPSGKPSTPPPASPTTPSPSMMPNDTNNGTSTLVPTAAPSATSTTSEPTDPGVTSSPTVEDAQISSASPTAAPSASLTMIGSTFSPTSIGEPSTASPTSGIFECTAASSGGSVSLGDQSDSDATAVFLVVGYEAESNSNSTEDYLDELELQLAKTAINAALGCEIDDGGNVTNLGDLVLVETFTENDPCVPSEADAVSCTILETEIVFFLTGDVDLDQASFDGYKSIEESMTNNVYVGVVPTIVKLEYLSPTNLPNPPQLNDRSGTTPPRVISSSAQSNRISLNPVAIGACIATIMGALVSAAVWGRNRRERNRRRHIQLSGEESLEEGSNSRNLVTV